MMKVEFAAESDILDSWRWAISIGSGWICLSNINNYHPAVNDLQPPRQSQIVLPKEEVEYKATQTVFFGYLAIHLF